jgi:hypothetical protein
MRFTSALAVLPLASAFVIHDAELFANIEKSGRRVMDQGQSVIEDVESTGRHVLQKGQTVLETSRNALDEALGKAIGGVKSAGEDVYSKIHKAGCDVDSWLEGSSFEDIAIDISDDHHDHPPHHGPPHHGKPHHPPHSGEPNLTVYEMISKSNYTTKLAKLIDEYPDLVEKLNSTKANYTVFAPVRILHNAY